MRYVNLFGTALKEQNDKYNPLNFIEKHCGSTQCFNSYSGKYVFIVEHTTTKVK